MSKRGRPPKLIGDARFLERQCQSCGVRFRVDLVETHGSDRKYCSTACLPGMPSNLRSYQRTVPDCVCQGCGIIFRPRANDRLKYCSRRCFFEHHPRRKRKEPKPQPVTVECARCTKPFKQGKRTRYCSKACAGWQRRSRYDGQCPTCRRQFDRHGNAKYCSRQCALTGRRVRDWLGLDDVQELKAVPSPLLNTAVLYRRLNEEIAKRYA